jgi:predicted nucleic-acid-binding protein
MIGLDTNVIVRYLAQDDAVQSPKATQIFERRLNQHNPGFISTVAIAEAVWVLERSYGVSGTEIAAAVERILQSDVLVVENSNKSSVP